MRKAAVAGLVTVALLALGGGCGSASKDAGSTSKVTSTVAAGGVSGATSSPGRLMGDEDNDYKGDVGKAYYDSDDNRIRYYGHAASAADARAIMALVKRYYAAAAAGDGATVCALTRPIVAETMPENYGQPPGPRYLRGASTCAAVLSIVFKHFHDKLTVPVRVTNVRVSGDRADVLLGFKTLQAGEIKMRRERGSWKIDGLLAVALP
jgi:hypothetical protein